jgi:glucose-specific phosphotransferase system IIA component
MSAPIFAMPIQGELLSIEQVSDPVFSTRMMGDGFAIIPTGEHIVAPFSGRVEVVFPTGHAIVLNSDDGISVLIHIGLDTVNLKGEGFEVLIKQGDQVLIGDPLIKIDLNFIKNKGYDMTTPIVFLSGQKVVNVNTSLCKVLQRDIITIR